MPLTLTRELRFGLSDGALSPPEASNGFAGNPALAGLAPFLCLAATVASPVDPRTGMVVNIKLLDRVMRQHAVPCLRAAVAEGRTAPAALVILFRKMAEQFAPHALEKLRLSPSPFLHFTVDNQEPVMVQLSLRFEFSAAHRLHSDALSEQENWDVFGRCNNPNGHGHNYELEVSVTGPVNAQGHVLPVLALQQIVNQHVVEAFDHKHLNLDCADFHALNPTVENIARVIFGRLKPHIPAPARLATLRLWETPKTMAEYSE